MHRLRNAAAALIAGGMCAAFAASASAATTPATVLGMSTLPPGADAFECNEVAYYVQLTDVSGYTYTVPPGGGRLLDWSTNTTGATAGASVRMLVLRPTGPDFMVVAADERRLPSPLPADGVATFRLDPPITLGGGEKIAFSGAEGATCFYARTGTTSWFATGTLLSPPLGALLTYQGGLPRGYLTNVSARLVNRQDVAVTAAAFPAAITAGGLSSSVFTVHNNGPAEDQVTFSTTVPNGLTIRSAVAGLGDCTVTGQTVTCTITGLEAGASVPVSLIVSAPAAGTYAISGTATAFYSDPSPGDNTAGAALTVNDEPVIPPPDPPTPPAPPACKTIPLTGMTLTLAKQVVVALNCTVGKVTKRTSKRVKRGLVIATSPGAGKTLTNGSAVSVVQSSGPPPKRRQKAKAKQSP